MVGPRQTVETALKLLIGRTLPDGGLFARSPGLYLPVSGTAKTARYSGATSHRPRPATNSRSNGLRQPMMIFLSLAVLSSWCVPQVFAQAATQSSKSSPATLGLVQPTLSGESRALITITLQDAFEQARLNYAQYLAAELPLVLRPGDTREWCPARMPSGTRKQKQRASDQPADAYRRSSSTSHNIYLP